MHILFWETLALRLVRAVLLTTVGLESPPRFLNLPFEDGGGGFSFGA